MSNPADANVTDPKTFTITPGDPVSGAPVDDYTIEIGASDVNNTPPTTWTSMLVPAKDLTPDASGNVKVPVPDIVQTALKPGTYGARCEADSGAVMSDPTAVIFFNVSQPKPNPPKGFTVA